MAGKCGIDPAFVIRALQKRMSHLVPEVINAAPRILTSRPSSRARVCVLGAGPTGLYSAQKLIPHCDVTVIDSKDYFEFTPSVLRVLTDPLHIKRVTFGYQKIYENLGIKFVHGRVNDITERSVHIAPSVPSEC